MPAASAIAKLLRRLRRGFSLPASVATEAAADKIVRGPDAATKLSKALADVAGAPPVGNLSSVDYAVIPLRQVEVPTDLRPGGALTDAGLDKSKMDPLKRGKALLDRQVPELPESSKQFLSKEGAITREEWLAQKLEEQRDIFRRDRERREGQRLQRRKKGDPPIPPGSGPLDRPPIRDPSRLLPVKAESFRNSDDSFFSTLFGGPMFVLDDARDPIAQSIYRLERLARLHANKRAGEFDQRLVKANEVLARTKNRTETSKNFFQVVNGIPGTPKFNASMSRLGRTGAEAALDIRRFLTEWLDGNPQIVQDFLEGGVGVSDIERKNVVDDFNRRGVLERVGLVVHRESDFFYHGKDGARHSGNIPLELQEVDFGDNAALAHLFGGTPREDIIESMRAVTTGMIQKEVLQPAFREMEKAAANLPKNKQLYVRQWLRALKGVPTTLEDIMENAFTLARTKLGFNFARGGATELSGYLLSGLYRGALHGNGGYYLANFVGQAFANPGALHGPYRAFEGIARHFTDSFEGKVPSQALMGGFETLFGRDIPRTAFGKKLNKIPGVRDLRRFLRWLDENSGPSRSEFINRSVGMHIGLAHAIDKFNARTGKAISWQDIMRNRVDQDISNRLMFEALMESERVNFVYGVDGANPFLSRILGRHINGHFTQFLSFFPKQAEFLLGPLFKHGDPGVFMRYLLLGGFASRLLGRAWGVDLTSSFFFGSVPRTSEGVPLPMGPSAQFLWLTFRAVNSEDEVERKRLTEEMMRIAGLLLHPGALQREKTVRFFEALRYERLISRNGPPYELMRDWGPTAGEQSGPIFGEQGGFDPRIPKNLDRNIENIIHSETPARALGFPTLSDRQERRILKEIKRVNTIWLSQARDLVDEMVSEMQTNGTETEKFQELVQRAAEDQWPIQGMLQSGVRRAILPRVLRTFLDSPRMTKAMFFDLLESMYGEALYDTAPLELEGDTQRFFDSQGVFQEDIDRPALQEEGR